MKIKKPSLKGQRNCGYLGHFSKDKYLCEGHNTSGRFAMTGGDLAKSIEQDRATKEKYRKIIREKLDKNEQIKITYDKPVEQMTPEEKRQNAYQTEMFYDVYDEETAPLKSGKMRMSK